MATQNRWLERGLDPLSKADRVANYVKTLRRDLLKVSETCGVDHPALLGPQDVEILDNLSEGRLLDEVYDYETGWGYPSAEDRARIGAIMDRIEEAETGTEGPPETAERGERGDAVAGDLPTG